MKEDFGFTAAVLRVVTGGVDEGGHSGVLRPSTELANTSWINTINNRTSERCDRE